MILLQFNLASVLVCDFPHIFPPQKGIVQQVLTHRPTVPPATLPFFSSHEIYAPRLK
jgi:hypothetical protein